MKVDHELVFSQVFRDGVIKGQAFPGGGIHEIYLDSLDARFGKAAEKAAHAFPVVGGVVDV